MNLPHPGMLIAYTDTGEVIATLDYTVMYDDSPDRLPLGLIHFSQHEEAGGSMLDVWEVAADGLTIKGSKVWPEYLGGAAQDFTVELDGPPGNKRISALVHKVSGHRRERAVIEAAIQARIDAAQGEPADIRDLVGGPDKPLLLDDRGDKRVIPVVQQRPNLPVVQPRRVTEPRKPKHRPGRGEVLPIPSAGAQNG